VAAQESGAGEFSVGASSNGAPEHHREPVAARESFAPPPEPQEPQEPREEPREASPRREEPPAPLAHFEPSPPTESNTSRDTKPYVVWSSAPPPPSAPGGGRGPEE
jgi:hypothetical protein